VAVNPQVPLSRGGTAWGQSEARNTGYSSVFDVFFPDDTQKIPVVGPVAKAVGENVTRPVLGALGTAAGAVGAAADRVYAGSNRILSWGISAVPMGIETLDWNSTAGDVTPGEAAISNTIRLADQTKIPQLQAAKIPFQVLDSDNPVLNPNFDVADEEQRTEAFRSGGFGQLASGATDVAVQFILDPLVVAGKGIKIARVGSKTLGLEKFGFAGLTNRTISDYKTVERVGVEADDAIKIYRGEIKDVKDNTIGRIADEVTRGDFNALRNLPQFENNPNRDLLASIGATINDKADAITFIAAATGNQRYIAKLRKDHMSAYDALKKFEKSSLYEEQELARPIGEWPKAVSDKTLEPDLNARALLDDLIIRNAALSKAVGVVDEGQAMLTNIGVANFGPLSTASQIAAAWRAGKTQRLTGAQRKDGLTRNPLGARGIQSDFDEKVLAKSGLKADEKARLSTKREYGTGPAAFETVYQISSAVRPVRLWTWLGGYHASGYIDLRGPNMGKASDEALAALTDSKTIGRDKAFVDEQMRIFGNAIDPTARMAAVERIEQNSIEYLARQYDVKDLKTVKEIYRRIATQRDDVVKQFRSQGYAVLPDGSLATGDPMLISQLEVSMPMMDFRAMEETVKIAAKPQYNWARADEAWATSESFKNLFEEAQSLWKASVLLRLGYTQRNVAEGWLRSAAAIGTVPALRHMPTGVKNFSMNTSKRVRKGQLTKIVRDQDELAKKYNENQIKISEISDADEILALETSNEIIKARMDDLGTQRAYLSKRDYIGSDGAFSGDHGDMYRRMASNESTVDIALRSRWMVESNSRLAQKQWALIAPDQPQYWDELSSAVRQFRSDPVARLALEGKTQAEMVKWMRAKENAWYRRSMELTNNTVAGRAVSIKSMVDRYLPTQEVRAAAAKSDLDPVNLEMMLGTLRANDNKFKKPNSNNYIDKTTGAVDNDRYLKAVEAYNKKMKKVSRPKGELSPIHGRQVALEVRGQQSVLDTINRPVNALFKYIGTLPESTLVRQPFYAEVWQREYNRIFEIARNQGTDITDDLLEKINKNAHTVAMRATNETLYTIERLSNPARLFKWVMPFYPAWENSAKVWTKLIMNDPSILPRANILWNIPNSLGMVYTVDENGKTQQVGKEGYSFLTGAQDRFIMLPKGLAEKIPGGFATDFKVYQGAFNVVTPGETPYIPGFGPLVPLVAGKVLAARPDIEAYLRQVLPASVFGQIAPFGELQTSVVDAFAAPVLRKEFIRWQGEDNDDYLSVMGSMTQTMMVQWYENGADPDDQPDYDDIMQATNNFFRFSSLASATLAFPLARVSKYQLQIDTWNNLKKDNTLTYQQKIDKFVANFGASGENYLPLTVSTSKYVAKAIDPTLGSYKILAENEELVRSLARLDPEAVGVIANTAPHGEFDRGVYRWLSENEVPGTNDTYRAKKSPDEMLSSIEMQQAWREYNKVKIQRDEALEKLGVKSINSNAAAPLKAAWDFFTGDYMTEKYGDQWAADYNKYTDMTSTYLIAINQTLENEKFMSNYGDTPLWRDIKGYMEMRASGERAVASGEMDSATANEAFAAWASSYRYTSYEFADFWDRYLENDQLSKESGR
jgi:hypothetical protein